MDQPSANDAGSRPAGPRPYAVAQRAKRLRPTGLPRSSRRVMSAGRRAWYALLVLMIRGVLALLWGSCRVLPVRGNQHLEKLMAAGSPAIIAYWHQMQLFGAWYVLRMAQQGLRVTFLTSPSVSGEVPAAIIPRFGAGVLRGSAKRSAGQTLKDMYEVLTAQRASLVIAPDGPTGPLHEFKPGNIMLARMARVPIVLVAYAASPCIRWRSWDRSIVPWPFARVAIAVDEPILIPAKAGTDDLVALRLQIEERMAALVRTAEAMLAG